MRGLEQRAEWQRRVAAAVFGRKVRAAGREADRELAALPRRAAELDRAAARLAERREHALRAARVTLAAHDPQRTLERGYALVTAADGEPLATAGAVRAAGRFQIRMADAAVPARVDEDRSPDDHD
jgi:exodeoxyribonuclease VII large subunit